MWVVIHLHCIAIIKNDSSLLVLKAFHWVSNRLPSISECCNGFQHKKYAQHDWIRKFCIDTSSHLNESHLGSIQLRNRCQLVYVYLVQCFKWSDCHFGIRTHKHQHRSISMQPQKSNNDQKKKRRGTHADASLLVVINMAKINTRQPKKGRRNRNQTASNRYRNGKINKITVLKYHFHTLYSN